MKNKINDILKRNIIKIDDKLYDIKLNNDKEITSVNLDTNKSYKYLNEFIKVLSNDKTLINYDKYINKYYKHMKTKNNNYILVPLGIISDNPFIYNSGPKIIMSYDYIMTYTLKIEVNVKNYGLNNALIETILLVKFEQSIFKPILKKVSSFNYSYILDSKIINGRIPLYLGNNLTSTSKSIITS